MYKQCSTPSHLVGGGGGVPNYIYILKGNPPAMITRFYTPPPSALYTMSGFQTTAGGGGSDICIAEKKDSVCFAHDYIYM